jgi:hypothetical protein
LRPDHYIREEVTSMFTTVEAAGRVGCRNVWTVYNAIRCGFRPRIKVGRTYLWDSEDVSRLKEFLVRQSAERKAAT